MLASQNDNPYTKGPLSRVRARGQRIKRGLRRDLKREFLREYRKVGIVSATCLKLGLTRTTFYGWCKRDRDFHAQYRSINDARFDAEMAQLKRMYPTIDGETYWRNASERQLVAALGRMSRRRAKSNDQGRCTCEKCRKKPTQTDT